MFALEPNASKAAFVALLGQLIKWQFSFVDCQVHTSHLARFGAIDLKRRVFLRQLQIAASHPTHLGPWQLDIDVAQAIELIDGLKHNPQR